MPMKDRDHDGRITRHCTLHRASRGASEWQGVMQMNAQVGEAACHRKSGS